MIRLLLVRHGETAWNGTGRLQGRQDIALSATGAEQVRALLPAVQAFAPQRVITSSLRRTQQTADALGLRPHRCDARLDEADLGQWEGEHSARIRQERPGEYETWRAGRLRPPGGESFAELTDRVADGIADAVAETAAAGESGLLVVTHGGPIRALLRRTVGLDPGLTVPAHPGSLSVLEVDERRPADEPGAYRLRLFNHAPSAPFADPAD